jgi:hypothetical protein
VRDQVSHPHKTTGRIMVLYILTFRFLDTRREEKGSGLNGSKHSCCSQIFEFGHTFKGHIRYLYAVPLGRARESVLFRGPCTYFTTNIIFLRWRLLDPRPVPGWRATPCRPSATAYSIYSHLPSTSGGRLLYPQPEDSPWCGDKGPT